MKLSLAEEEKHREGKSKPKREQNVTTKPAPLSQPNRFKTTANRDMVTCVSPCMKQFACCHFEFTVVEKFLFISLVLVICCFGLTTLDRKAPQHGLRMGTLKSNYQLNFSSWSNHKRASPKEQTSGCVQFYYAAIVLRRTVAADNS